ncbi:hypothetical protein K7G98_03015 [Saccharothrix sp. MB29]|nr:hypothetical protein [Saccharothrix sp. MB29]
MTNSRVPVRGGKALSMLKRLGRLVRVLAAGGLLAVAGCGGASSDDGPVRVSVWAWYPSSRAWSRRSTPPHRRPGRVDQRRHRTRPVRQAEDRVHRGQGAPDVAMVEFQQIPTFVILDALVDMGQYGANDDEPLYAEWAWSQATDGDRVYAIPVDGGRWR